MTAEEARELLQYRQQHGHFPEEALLRILRCNQPVCTAECKPSRKDNPNCLCSMVPPLGSFRKKGLWTKEPAVVAQLGVDPTSLKRQVR